MVTVELSGTGGHFRVLVLGPDRSQLFVCEGPARIALSAFAAWIESPEGMELVGGVHRSEIGLRRW